MFRSCIVQSGKRNGMRLKDVNASNINIIKVWLLRLSEHLSECSDNDLLG